MKKLLCLLLVLMMVFSLFACAPEESSDDDKKKDGETTESTDDTGKDPTDSEDPTGTLPLDPDDPTVPDDVIPGVEGFTFVDSDGITIVGKEIKDGYGALELVVEITNNTENDLTFVPMYAAIYDFQIDASMWAEVPKGETREASVYFYEDDMALIGLENLGTLTISFRALLGATEIWVSDPVKVAAAVDTGFHAFKLGPNATTVYESGTVKVVVSHVAEASGKGAKGPCLAVFVQNLTDSKITVYVEQVSLNGIAVRGSFYTELYTPYSISLMSFFAEDLQANNITEINSADVAFTMKVHEEYIRSDVVHVEF